MQRPSRYQKQMLFAGIGEAGQQRLRASSVLVVGCGALGCVLADSLTRAGVGRIRIIDRDFVELSNLQRQILFDEQDVHEHLPKAIAAQRRLERVNSEIVIEPIVADLDFSSIGRMCADVHLILDGTDNFETRYLINDAALEYGVPWIFTGVTGSSGQVLAVLPKQSPCLRCLMPQPPPPGATETCDTAGVLGPAVGVLASLQAAIALKVLTGHAAELPPQLTLMDVWTGTHRQVDLTPLLESRNCPACHQGERLWLQGTRRAASTVLCGRNAVQISPAEPLSLTLTELADRLRGLGAVVVNRFLLRWTLAAGADTADFPAEVTVFPDGRAIIRGTSDPRVARSLYSRYIGG
ncbi:MAG: ThiF family adenylyltransferase [Planctomycetota bacterium]